MSGLTTRTYSTTSAGTRSTGDEARAASGPPNQAHVREADDLRGGLPLARALGRQVLWRPRSELLAEPASLVAARQGQERGGVSFGGELHRRAGDAAGLVIWMRVDEQSGAGGFTLA